MQLKELLQLANTTLNKANIDTAQLDAELLLAFVLEKNREYILTNFNKEISKKDIKHYLKLIKKRTKGHSVAVLIGNKDFYGLNFIVNKNVLIPRPETEIMVDEVNNILKDINNTPTIIDLGTGSGCIIISIAKKNNHKNINFHAVDISKKALKIAKQNAKKHKLEKLIDFHKGNLLKPLKKTLKDSKTLIITANLPYLSPKQVKNSPSIHKEPKLALIAGNDGLKYYKKLFQDIFKNHKDKKCYILCEIDPSQTTNIKQLAKNELPNYSFRIIKDYSNLDRFFVLNS